MTRGEAPDHGLVELGDDGAAEALTELVSPAEPSAQARARLTRAIEGDHRYAPFTSRLTRVLDLDPDALRVVLARARLPEAWEAGPVPGVELFHFDGGRRLASADAGLVRMPTGARSPVHRHDGHELVFILEGRIRDGISGDEHAPGDLIHHGPGSAHWFEVLGDQPLVYVLVVEGEIALVGPPPM